MLDMIEKKSSSLQLYRLKDFGARVNKLGFNFAICNSRNELLLLCEADKFKSNERAIIDSCSSVIEQFRNGSENRRLLQIEDRYISVVLQFTSSGDNDGEIFGVALVDLGPNHDNNTLCESLGQMLELLVENFQAAADSRGQIEMVSTELAQVYEELVLLHKLSMNMRITESDSNYLQMACDSLTDIVSVEGIAILLEKTIDGEKQLVLAAGSGLIELNQHTSSVLCYRLEEEINKGKEALLDSEVDAPFRYDWADNIKNIIAVPLLIKDKTGTGITKGLQKGYRIIGFMTAINRIDKPDFDSTDVKLFNSVANGCAVFIENGKLFNDLKELFIGSLKALTSSIDAKDQYTRGHSERVAFISKWIAERFSQEEALTEREIHRVYLAGLLHDIGKMGVNEAVLCKQGKLTKQEFECIKTHPSIGEGILGEIKQMRDIVPGVLCHHERIDGRGYPNGLTGDRIPLIGKIVGLADSFDAMTSKRTYRDAMTVEQALEEIERGLGTQFDEKIGRMFINSNVYQLWDMIQGGSIGMGGSGDSVEYGTVAVGTLIG